MNADRAFIDSDIDLADLLEDILQFGSSETIPI
jgi:hypothetical protein